MSSRSDIRIDELERDQRGAVLVEFAIIIPIIIMVNILVFDLSTYFRVSERSQHAAHMIHKILVNDPDHTMVLDNLERFEQYHAMIIGQNYVSADAALLVIDAMPLNLNGSWSLVVCWSWSSNPSVYPPPVPGSKIFNAEYAVDPWIPVSGLSASSAIIIVATRQIFRGLLGNSYLQRQTSQSAIGPVRYVPSLPINIILSRFPGGAVLNENQIRDPNSGNALLCQR